MHAPGLLWRVTLWATVLELWIGQWIAECAQLTAEDRDTIVALHNQFRAQVLPSATNMQRMRWDDDLADVAAKYVTKCIWDHNPDLVSMGENLHATNGPLNTTKAITEWYMENLDYNYHNNSCEEDKMCGHYTQVVWAETNSVGCSTHLCEEVEGLHFGNVNMLVCNYSPQGNFIGEKPYEEGEPCSKCPTDLQDCDMNMCVPEMPRSTPEGTTEGPQPAADTPTPTQAPSGSTTMETGGDVTSSPGDSSSPPSVPVTEDGGMKEKEKEKDQEARGVISACSPLLLAAALMLYITL
ncbi:hypothetical protein AGOR_G00140820 [Albula goreensis]|uniref:SCP domain-containing protein n=1 Tax=Albula goreensis TaxID=1534307 RepID=A0A8T3DC38_9TELE|nr:hypothetical protein AGOR_G00140820 [Albula goreensis]